MSRDFAPEFTTADLPVTERFPDWETDPSIYENLDEVGFWDRFDITGDLVGDAPDLIEEQIQKGTDEPFELQEAKFDWGNLGTDEYSPSVDLNIMNIQDREKREAAIIAAIRFNTAWKQGESGDYYGELEKLYQDYLDAVEAGAQ